MAKQKEPKPKQPGSRSDKQGKKALRKEEIEAEKRRERDRAVTKKQ
jgi:hypothetical protein